MYIKIYFNEKPVFLCDELNSLLKEILHHPDAMLIEGISTNDINTMLHEIKKDQFHAGVIIYKDMEVLKKSFFKQFTLIEAAGGFVQNELDEILFIFRLNKWDLPKGKVELNEDIAACAIREVEEETGAKNISIINKIGETYHTYTAYGKYFLKTTHWYRMQCNSVQNLLPQIEEDITEIKWIPKNQLPEVLNNTYPSIKDLVEMMGY